MLTGAMGREYNTSNYVAGQVSDEAFHPISVLPFHSYPVISLLLFPRSV